MWVRFRTWNLRFGLIGARMTSFLDVAPMPAFLEIFLSFAWSAAVVWLMVRAFRQRHLLEPIPRAFAPESAARVAIIIPARDEEENIERCLLSLVRQDYPATHLDLVVVDDHSTDATCAKVDSLARSSSQIRLLRSPPLPAGWIGKSHACWVGAQAAAAGADWLCFMDADVWAEPPLLASAVQAACREGLDLLSLSPRQHLNSFAERLVMPCGLYLLAFCQDLRKLQSGDSTAVTATGQFMLIRRAAYRQVGGHAAVRNAICEDVALAALIKASGNRVILHDGSRLLSTRMYTGWSTLWLGTSKNVVDMLGGPRSTVVLAAAAATLAWAAWLIPLADAVSCKMGSAAGCVALIPALLGSAAAFGLHIAGARYFGAPAWYGLLFALGYSAGALIAIDGVRRRFNGRISWKGRTYP
jgi:chlorobactene glucosyltransferase